MADHEISRENREVFRATNLTRLQAKHHRVLEMTLEGLSTIEIARQLGKNRVTIQNIIRSPAGQQELARRRQERAAKIDEVSLVKEANARTELENASSKAARTQVKFLDADDEKIAQKAAMDILDRTGFARVERKELVSAHVILDETALERLLTANQSCFPNEPIQARPLEGT